MGLLLVVECLNICIPISALLRNTNANLKITVCLKFKFMISHILQNTLFDSIYLFLQKQSA